MPKTFVTARGRTSPAVDVGWKMGEHDAVKCRDRARCTGPGCNLNTGKTERKRKHRAEKADA